MVHEQDAAGSEESRAWIQLEATEYFEYEGEGRNSIPDGFGRAWWSDGSWYRGTFAMGRMDGEGEFGFKDGARFRGRFRDGMVEGEGVLMKDGRRFRVSYNEGQRDFRRAPDVTPATQEELGCGVVEREACIPVASVMKGGEGSSLGDFSHIRSFDGKLAHACPFQAHRKLSNAASLQGKIAVVQRGNCSLSRKLRFVQEAGAEAMVVVGTDNLDKFAHMLQVIEGATSQDEDPPVQEEGESGTEEPLRVQIPVIYVLAKHEQELVEGALCRVVFGERTPRTPATWMLGGMVVPAQTVYGAESKESMEDLLQRFLREGREEQEQLKAQRLQQKSHLSGHRRHSASVPPLRFPADDCSDEQQHFAPPKLWSSALHAHFTPRTRQYLPTNSETLHDFFALPLLVFREVLAGSCGSMTFSVAELLAAEPRGAPILEHKSSRLSAISEGESQAEVQSSSQAETLTGAADDVGSQKPRPWWRSLFASP